MRDVVEIDDRAEVARGAEFDVGGFVGGEHDAVAAQADRLAEAEFGKRGAVGAEAFGREDLEQEGIGRGLDGEELAEGREDGEGLRQAAGVGADGGLVVEVEGGGEALCEGFGLFAGEGEGLGAHGSVLRLWGDRLWGGGGEGKRERAGGPDAGARGACLEWTAECKGSTKRSGTAGRPGGRRRR